MDRSSTAPGNHNEDSPQLSTQGRALVEKAQKHHLGRAPKDLR